MSSEHDASLSARERAYVNRMCGGEVPSHILSFIGKVRDKVQKVRGVELSPAECAIIIVMAEEFAREAFRKRPQVEDSNGCVIKNGTEVVCSHRGRVYEGVVVDDVPDGKGRVRVDIGDAIVRLSPKNMIIVGEKRDDNV